jgi:Fe-S-cluster containining protein
MSLTIIKEDDEPWYSQGLPFKCTECGGCCTGSPGYIWVSDQEIVQIADHLKVSIDHFMQNYVRYVDGKLSLLEDHKNYDCVFLKDKKCSIYSVRPKQCRTFPWWPRHLKSKEDWDAAASYCEGINHPEACTVPLNIIEEQLNLQNQ